METKEKIIFVLLVIVLVLGGIVTLHSKINFGSPFAFLIGTEPPERRPKSEPTQELVATVNLKTLNLRPSPNTNNTPIKVLSEGTKVKVFSVDNDGWAKVVDDTGVEGYLFNEYLRY